MRCHCCHGAYPCEDQALSYPESALNLPKKPRVKRVEIPLTFDAEFFDILLDDVTSLDALQSDEQKILGAQIEALSSEVTAVTKYVLSLFIPERTCSLRNTDSKCLDVSGSRKQTCIGGGN